MKQAIFITAIIAIGTAFPVGLITGVMINRSLVASKVALSEIDAAKGKEASVQAETLQKQNEVLRNKNVHLTQELSSTKTKAANEIKLLQKETSDTIAEQKQIFEKQKSTLNEQENEIKRILSICWKNGIETDPEKLKKVLSGVSIAPSFKKELEVGQIAYVAGENRLTATQVVDKNNVICNLIIRAGTNIGHSSGNYTGGFQEINPSLINVNTQSTAPTPELSETIWLAHFDTTGLVDGAIVKCNRPLKVSGTKTYETALGTSTIFVFEPYQIDDR